MHPRTPVLIGAGQFTYRGAPGVSPSPLDLLKTAVERARLDAGLAPDRLREIDTLAVVGFAIDAPGPLASLPVPRLANPPAALARSLGAAPRWSAYGHMGGDSPQVAINLVHERIARGDADFALIAGAEFLGSLLKRMDSGTGFADWEAAGVGADDVAPMRYGDPRDGADRHEARHGLNYPVNTYPLFENALRARDGRSLDAHMDTIGRLFAPFTEIAARHPEAWFRQARSAQDLIEDTPQNRIIAYPYRKRVNAIMQVDQSAALFMTSLARARELGVGEDRMVFLRGYASAHDHWSVLEREAYTGAPAIRHAVRRALDMAGASLDQMQVFDIYSCFPSAVRIAAEEIGLATDDPRGLTVTGGLPYFGGPGNNYTMHAVATLMERLRSTPGAFGLATANGWFLTKHAVGVYSTQPPASPPLEEAPGAVQALVDAGPKPETVLHPEGPARIETYTVVHSRDSYRLAVVIGRDDQNRRFVAVTPDDESTLRDLEAREGVGRTGFVRRHADGKRNLFTPH